MAPREADGAGDSPYRLAWGEVGAAMVDGVSWSGHERNRAWIATEQGDFADASFVTGLDHVDDGRVALRVDWDLDGDEDLFLRFRSGPMLRYMERSGSDPGAVVLRDADLARVPAGERPVAIVVGVGEASGAARRVPLRPVTDGYLACADARASVGTIQRRDGAPLAVELAGGEELPVAGAEGAAAGALRLARTDGGNWALLPATRPAPVALASGELEAGADPPRVVLRLPLPLPPGRRTDSGAAAGPRLLVVRTEGCGVCERVVPVLERELAGDEIVLTVVTAGDSMSRTGAFLGAVARSILGPGTELGSPLVGLIDGRGRLHSLYMGGEITPAMLRLDARSLAGTGAVKAAFRSAVGPLDGRARWFHRGVRSVQVLIHELAQVGLETDAAAYSSMAR